MARISKKITINAPVEKVFNFLVNPSNWTKYVTNLTDIRDVSSDTLEPGTTFKWSYQMLGLKFHGKGHVTEKVNNSKFAKKMEGHFPVTESFTFTQLDKGMELAVDIEYELPGKVDAVAPKSVMEKINKKEAATVLEKIKTLCEGL